MFQKVLRLSPTAAAAISSSLLSAAALKLLLRRQVAPLCGRSMISTGASSLVERSTTLRVAGSGDPQCGQSMRDPGSSSSVLRARVRVVLVAPCVVMGWDP